MVITFLRVRHVELYFSPTKFWNLSSLTIFPSKFSLYLSHARKMGLETHRLLNNSHIDLWCVFTFSTIFATFWWINISWEKFTHQFLQLIFYSQPLNFNYFWRLKIDLTMTNAKKYVLRHTTRIFLHFRPSKSEC